MWHCSRELKCQQGDTLHTFGIYCSRGSHKFCVFMAKWLELQNSTTEILVSFPEGQYRNQLVNYNIVNFSYKTNDGRDKRSNYAIFVVLQFEVLVMLQVKPCSAREEHLTIQLLWATVIHTFIVLSTQSPYRKSGRGVTAKFHLVVFVYRVNQENKDSGRVQDSQHKWWKASLKTFFKL